ncbi:16S rRNA (cytidine(1402)-2'-O)-methyltransferase [Aureispira anguillae]|uniref:Ribosomal RNA small subunit methyltransferase I n=1 Tax=Aureispira anguillae TaxID=2864201 RepID=A0A916DUD2_9BACT|nr:16S rRNA (cytidine(1402)-2'-O)-methyltransferase [Aureispira anguillae]BDS12430.1 16S rRNA (cytidine(1402)-2'-O)-methyltransferase [Aureispira anguillae]
MLYLVPTPIGNLEDITLRALRILKEVDLVLAEDTRTSKKLFQHYEISTPLRSHHAHNENQAAAKVVEDILAGATIALISDAGTPGISDPGFSLIRACVEANIKVECLPGATAIIPALVASGLPCNRFYFEGFLPHKKGRQTRLLYLAELPCTFALYESPHRLGKCLEQLAAHCGAEREAVVCREISKMFEEYVKGTLAELAEKVAKNELKAKGEIVIVVAGKEKEKKKKRYAKED